MNKEIAQFILQLIATASVRADDQTISDVQVTKQWLNAIISGALVVVEPPKREDQ